MNERKLSGRLAKAVQLVELMEDSDELEDFVENVLFVMESKTLETAQSNFRLATRSLCELAIIKYGSLITGRYDYTIQDAMREIEVKLQGGE